MAKLCGDHHHPLVVSVEEEDSMKRPSSLSIRSSSSLFSPSSRKICDRSPPQVTYLSLSDLDHFLAYVRIWAYIMSVKRLFTSAFAIG